MTNTALAIAHDKVDEDDDGSIVGDDDPRPSCAICWRTFNKINRRQQTPCSDAVCRQAKTFCAECVQTYKETFATDRRNHGKPFLCPNCRTGTWGPPLRHPSSLHPSGYRVPGVRRQPSSPLSPRTQRRRSDSYNPQYRTHGFQLPRGQGPPAANGSYGQPFPYRSPMTAHGPGAARHISANYGSADESFRLPSQFVPAFQPVFHPDTAYHSSERPFRGFGFAQQDTQIPPPTLGYGEQIPFAQMDMRQAAAMRNREMMRRQHSQASVQSQSRPPQPRIGFAGLEGPTQNRMPMRFQHSPEQMHLQTHQHARAYGPAPPIYPPSLPSGMATQQHLRNQSTGGFGTLLDDDMLMPGNMSAEFTRPVDLGVNASFPNVDGLSNGHQDFRNPLAPAPPFGQFSSFSADPVQRYSTMAVTSRFPVLTPPQQEHYDALARGVSSGFPAFVTTANATPPAAADVIRRTQQHLARQHDPQPVTQRYLSPSPFHTYRLIRLSHRDDRNEGTEYEHDDFVDDLAESIFIARRGFIGERPMSGNNCELQQEIEDDGEDDRVSKERTECPRERKRPRLS